MTENTIAVVGGGFGGLRASLDISAGLRKHLLGGRYKVLLIDRSPAHLFTPLLYKYVALGKMDRSALALDLEGLLGNKSIQVIREEVSSLDPARGILRLSSGAEVRAAYVLLAPGSETNWFGIPGLKENALALKWLEDAENIRSALGKLPRGAKVLIGGGGPTGVELAAELALAGVFQISIIEAMPSILPGFPERTVGLADKRLRKLGVEVLTNEPVQEVAPNLARSKNGRSIPFDLFIWAGGVQVPAWIKDLPLKKEIRGRIETELTMGCLPETPDLKLAPMVYAIGDATCVHHPDGKPLPPMARPAIEEGRIAAANILHDILTAEGLDKNARRRTYEPVHYPSVVPAGGKFAIAEIGGFILSGWLGWIFKEIVAIYYLRSILPLGKALAVWKRGV